jgi:UDP-N-acetylmuramate--alanine ligase
MKPTIAVVTNIDREHLDHYADLAAIREAFVTFLSRVPFYGAAIVCLDDANVRHILPRLDRKVVTYGTSSEADVAASDIELSGFEVTFTARKGRTRLGKVKLQVPGRHSVHNSLAAIAVGLELDVPFRTIATALARFRGADRRLERKGTAFGAMVLDDYGHHPTEILATLQAVREGFGARTIVVFQPHRFTRTRALLEEFGGAFFLADRVIVTDIYAAGELPIPGVSAATVADSLVRHGHPSVVMEPRLDQVPRLVKSMVRPGDIVLTLGAGDVWKVGELLVREGSPRARRRVAR